MKSKVALGLFIMIAVVFTLCNVNITNSAETVPIGPAYIGQYQ